MNATPHRKHLVLVGAGRSHLQVLKGLAKRASNDLAVTLVTPSLHYLEPDMLPGFVAGDLGLEDLRVAIDPLVEASGVACAAAWVHSLDLATRRVQLSTGDALTYDVLSVDTEPVIERDEIEKRIPGARECALFVHPNEVFVQLWPQLQDLARTRPLQVALIADSLSGVELAMAMAHALAAPHGSRVTLVVDPVLTFLHLPPALQRRIQARLAALNITTIQGRCTAIERSGLHLEGGATLACDAPVLAAHAQTPSWLLQSGLELTEAGDPAVNERLQSESHRQVFIVPRSAPVQAGPVLESNLRTALDGGSFRKVPLNPPHLHVLSCGSRHAVAVWGGLSLQGQEVWHWKSRRDKRRLASLIAP